MKAYIASWFASKEEMKAHATKLRAAGIEVTSRWLEEKIAGTAQIKDIAESYLRETAQVDIQDILEANVLILNIPSARDLQSVDIPIASWARGGRHFEAGFHYATMVLYANLPPHVYNRGNRHLILVGHKENVFHHLNDLRDNGKADNFLLPSIETYRNWDDALRAVISLKETEPKGVHWR